MFYSTACQLGLHRKPCGLLNAASYYDHLLAFLDHTVAEGFVKACHRDMLVIADTAAGLLARFAAYEPPTATKWIQPNET